MPDDRDRFSVHAIAAVEVKDSDSGDAVRVEDRAASLDDADVFEDLYENAVTHLRSR